MCRCSIGIVAFLVSLIVNSFPSTDAFGIGRGSRGVHGYDVRSAQGRGQGQGQRQGGGMLLSQGNIHGHGYRHCPSSPVPLVPRMTMVGYNCNADNHHHHFGRTRSRRHGTQLFSMDDSKGAIEYSDFGDDFWAGDAQAAGGGDGGGPIPNAASSSSIGGAAMTELQQVLEGYQTVKTAQLEQNWQQGNWKVRGFSLDRYSAKDDAAATIASTTASTTASSMDELLTSDMTLERISGESQPEEAGGSTAISKIVLGSDVVVGRTDGSVFLVELGTEFWTKFESKLTLVETSNVTVAVEAQLVRNDEQKRTVQDVPFEVSHQFMAHPGNEITALLWTEHDDNDETIVVTADIAGRMTVWSIPDVSGERVFPLRNLEAHSDRIVALKEVTLLDNNNDNNAVLLLSASIDGSLALWDMWTGDLVYRCHMEESTGAPIQILSVDAKGDRVYLGLSTGHVVAYLVSEMVNAASEGDVCPMPNGRFLAHGEGGGVTAIACAEDSNSIITGGMDGIVKQWEILSRTQVDQKTTLEQWPRLANQRMKERAHLFRGHDNKITALQYHPNAILSAAIDGTVRAWSAKTGKEFFSMDGFSEEINSLCLAEGTLVTNGMNHFVCVHDFDIDGGNEVEDGYELEW